MLVGDKSRVHPGHEGLAPDPSTIENGWMDELRFPTRVQVEYIDAGTPITNVHYIGAPKGEIYGADHGTERFTPEVSANLRPQTPFKNLYLTGSHVVQSSVSQLLLNHKAHILH